MTDRKDGMKDSGAEERDGRPAFLPGLRFIPPGAVEFLDAAGVGLALVSPGGSFMACNGAFRRMVGFGEEAFKLLNAMRIVHPDDLPAVTALFASTSPEGRQVRMELRLLRSDGSICWTRAFLTLVLADSGRAECLTGLFQDVTDLRKAKERKGLDRPTLERVVEARTAELRRANEQLLKEAANRRRADRVATALHLITTATLHAADNLELMQVCHGVIMELFPADHFYIALCDGDHSQLSFPYLSDACRGFPSARGFARGLPEYVISTGEPLTLDRAGYLELVSRGEIDPEPEPPVSWLGVPLKDRQGRTVGAVSVHSLREGVVYDEPIKNLLVNISGQIAMALERKKAEENLRHSEARFRAIFERAGMGIAIISPEGRILEINQAGRDILGYSAEEFHALRMTDYNPPEDAEATRTLFASMLAGERDYFQIEKRYVHKSGSTVWGRQTVSLVRAEDGAPLFAVSMLEDITERKKAEDLLFRKAFSDELTGLPNRALFMDRLTEAVKRRRRRPDYGFAVLFLDLDRFKVVNDSLGHAMGDLLLRGIADRLATCMREVDTLARFGGDEFAVLLDGVTDVVDATHVVERLLDSFHEPFDLEGHEVYAGASIGVIVNSERYESVDDIMRDADTAMYRAKEQGRGRFEIFDRGMHQKAKWLLQLETDLRRARDRNELYMVLQPIVDLLSSRVRGFEALMRWDHPKLGGVSPADFIPLAEETGLIAGLDLWMVETACAQVGIWRRTWGDKPCLSVNVNLSARDFFKQPLPEVVGDILARTSCPGRCLGLEITEGLFLDGGEVVVQQLAALREMGVKVVIDDFGTGYSSLSYLYRFPLDGIKVDRSFIQGMQARNENFKIVQGMVSLGKNLNMEVVAEGVETREQAALLKYLGCTLVQGFYYSRPLKPPEADRLAADPVLHPAAS